MKKQTAVEWLVKKLNQEIDYIPLNKWDVISDKIRRVPRGLGEDIGPR